MSDLTEIEKCGHWFTEEIRSFGGDLLVYQCTTCLARVKPCPDCKLPLNERHRKASQGCTECKKGVFCNAKQPLCRLCAPATDGICADCHRPFSNTGRSVLRKKRYCDDTCKDRAYRKRAAAKAPPKTAEGEVLQ